MLEIISPSKTIEIDLIYINGLACINLDHLAGQLGVFGLDELLISNDISLYKANQFRGINLRDGFKLIILLSERRIRTYELENALIRVFTKYPELGHQFPNDWVYFP